MDIVNIDALKAQGRILDAADVDPNEDYFVLGKYTNKYTTDSFKYTKYPVWAIKAGDVMGIPTLQQVLDFNHDLIDGNNFQGTGAGVGNTGTEVIAHGTAAAVNNEGTSVIAIGNGATSANKKDNVTAIGQSAATKNEGEFVNAIGYNAAYENKADNVIALGTTAGQNNDLAKSVIISNVELPTFADYAAATDPLSITSITTANGATSGTYLFHNQATNSIGAVRIP
jgi:hypothetical protein